MNESTTLVSTVIEALTELVTKQRASLNGTPESIVGRSSLQDGMFDELGITLENTVEADKMRLMVQFSSVEHSLVIHRDSMWLAEHFQGRLIPLLQQAVSAWLQAQQGDAFWAHTVVVQFLYPAQYGAALAPHGILLVYSDEPRKAALRQRIDQYLEQAIWQGQYPPKELDSLFLLKHLLSPYLYAPIDAARVEKACVQMLSLCKVAPKRLTLLRNAMQHLLRQWADKVFLPKYFVLEEPLYGYSLFFSSVPDMRIGARTTQVVAEADHAAVLLLVFTGVQLIQHAYRDTGIAYLQRAGELGYQHAYRLLKEGSGLIDAAFTRLKTAELECSANDVQAQVSIKIVQETATAYEAALNFLSALLEQGFPRSYKIVLKSKVKAAFAVAKVGRGKTLQFFANAAQYPELFPALARYAQTAICEYEWYTDQENEYCAMPGSYAVFVLALADAQYLPLLSHYLEQVDDEHQMVHQQFLKTLVEQQGLTAQNCAIVVDGIGRVNGGFAAKVASAFETEAALCLLLEQSRQLEAYAVQTLVYFIWGSEAALRKAHKKANASPQAALLAELLAQAAYSR